MTRNTSSLKCLQYEVGIGGMSIVYDCFLGCVPTLARRYSKVLRTATRTTLYFSSTAISACENNHGWRKKYGTPPPSKTGTVSDVSWPATLKPQTTIHQMAVYYVQLAVCDKRAESCVTFHRVVYSRRA